jgi:hypothetical protein
MSISTNLVAFSSKNRANYFGLRAAARLLAASFTLFLAFGLPMRAPAIPLSGSIELENELAEELDPLDPSLRPGNLFDKDKATNLLKQPSQQNLWYRIPNSMVGEWRCYSATLTYVKDEVTRKEWSEDRTFANRESVSFGCLPCLDKLHWWQPAGSGYWKKAEGALQDTYFFNRKFDPLIHDDDRTVNSTYSVSFEVDKATNKILDVSQRESVETLTFVNEKVIFLRESTTEYDFDGKPKLTSRTTAKLRKRTTISGDSPVPQPDTETVRQLLAYLRGQHLDDEYKSIIRMTHTVEVHSSH